MKPQGFCFTFSFKKESEMRHIKYFIPTAEADFFEKETNTNLNSKLQET